MMRFKTLLGVSAIAGFAALAPSIGSAAQCQFGDEAGFTATVDVWTSTACVGQVESDNDDAATIAGLLGLTGLYQDTRAERENDGTITYDPTGIMSITAADDFLQGTWSVNSWDGVASAIFVVKGSNRFAVYVLDTTAGLNGGWSTQALENNGGNQPAYSHLSLYLVDCEEDDEDCGGGGTGGDVPLPGGLPLLASAAGIGYILRRRKR